MKLIKKIKKNVYCVEAYSPCGSGGCGGCRGQAGAKAYAESGNYYSQKSQQNSNC